MAGLQLRYGETYSVLAGPPWPRPRAAGTPAVRL